MLSTMTVPEDLPSESLVQPGQLVCVINFNIAASPDHPLDSFFSPTTHPRRTRRSNAIRWTLSSQPGRQAVARSPVPHPDTDVGLQWLAAPYVPDRRPAPAALRSPPCPSGIRDARPIGPDDLHGLTEHLVEEVNISTSGSA